MGTNRDACYQSTQRSQQPLPPGEKGIWPDGRRWRVGQPGVVGHFDSLERAFGPPTSPGGSGADGRPARADSGPAGGDSGPAGGDARLAGGDARLAGGDGRTVGSAGGRPAAPGARGQPVAAAFEPVISRLGTGVSFSSAWNSRSAWVRFHSTATPSGVW
jgi:hypothetical protein